MTDCRQTTTTFVAFTFQLKSLLERNLADNDYHKTFSELPRRHEIVLCEKVNITIVSGTLFLSSRHIRPTICFGVYEKFDSEIVKKLFFESYQFLRKISKLFPEFVHHEDFVFKK